MSLHKADIVPTAVPEKTTVVPIAPEELLAPELQAIFAIWDARRDARVAPAREEVLPRPLAAHLRYISLARVLSHADDYEFRFVGDAHVQAYGVNSQGTKISQIAAAAPDFGLILKQSYDYVRTGRAPLCYRGTIGRDAGDVRFVWFETTYLPLIGSGGEVDHVMNAAVYAPRNGKWAE